MLSWSVPLCPNGPITGYYVFYRRAELTESIRTISSLGYSSSLIHSNELSVLIFIGGFTLGETYSFHVRAFSNETNLGLADVELILTQSTQILLNSNDFQSVLSRVAASSQTLLIGLPSSSQLASIGITNIV